MAQVICPTPGSQLTIDEPTGILGISPMPSVPPINSWPTPMITLPILPWTSDGRPLQNWGPAPERTIKCPDCNGKGDYEVYVDGVLYWKSKHCDTCDGKGRVKLMPIGG